MADGFDKPTWNRVSGFLKIEDPEIWLYLDSLSSMINFG
jgi:hypothetical protein